LSVLLSFSFGHWIVCSSVFFLWSSNCLFFCLFPLVIALSVLLSFSFGHWIVCSSVFFLCPAFNAYYHYKVVSSSKWVFRSRKSKNRQFNGQRKKTEEQTIQWPKEKDRRTDNSMAKGILLPLNCLFFDLRLLNTHLEELTTL
jgi:hypothetical protein